LFDGLPKGNLGWAVHFWVRNNPISDKYWKQIFDENDICLFTPQIYDVRVHVHRIGLTLMEENFAKLGSKIRKAMDITCLIFKVKLN